MLAETRMSRASGFLFDAFYKLKSGVEAMARYVRLQRQLRPRGAMRQVGAIALGCSLALAFVGCSEDIRSTGSAESAANQDSTAAAAREGASLQRITVALNPGPVPEAVFELKGLPAELMSLLTSGAKEGERLLASFEVYTGAEIDNEQPAMLGERSVVDGMLVFTPQFPLQPGQSYTAIFSPLGLRDAARSYTGSVRQVFTLPRKPESPTTTVTAVYPTGDQLPQNLLKIYLHFSAPMSQEDSYKHIRLLNAAGEQVPDPFLELGEELWDVAGTRMTVLFDPGRIKQELQPREEVGPPLLPDQRYQLVIDSDWKDAAGNRLAEEFRKEFEVGPPDEVQPRIKAWRVEPPEPNSRGPLQVHFDEPLDHAMLQRVFVITGPDDEIIAGRVEVAGGETLWRFLPENPWKPGRYTITADSTLEDRSGNSLGRPFEVALSEPAERAEPPATVELTFDVAQPDGE